MAWIGFTDGADSRFDPAGLGAGPPGRVIHVNPDTLLARGTLMAETRLSHDGHPQTLIAFQRSYPWPCSFSLQALPGGAGSS